MFGRQIELQDIKVIGPGEFSWSSLILKQDRSSIVIAPRKIPQDNRIQRMVELIEMLALKANQCHEEARIHYQDEKGPVLVTRLLMCEYSLYTKNTPLSLKEYRDLICAIERIATDLQPNVHLLIATLPVLGIHGLRNCALYVQSTCVLSDKPLIHHFDKQFCADSERLYATSEANIYNFESAKYDTAFLSALEDTPVRQGDVNQYKSALKITTAERCTFITAIEICLDHRHHLAADNIMGLVMQLDASQERIPFYWNQIITSNTIEAFSENLFTSLSHVDAMDLQALVLSEVINNLPFGNGIHFLKNKVMASLPYRSEMLGILLLFAAVDLDNFISEMATLPRDNHSDVREEAVNYLKGLTSTHSNEEVDEENFLREIMNFPQNSYSDVREEALSESKSLASSPNKATNEVKNISNPVTGHGSQRFFKAPPLPLQSKKIQAYLHQGKIQRQAVNDAKRQLTGS